MYIQPVGFNSSDIKTLRKATEEFVGYFYYRIFKKLWDSIPRGGLIPETSAERMFRDMLLYEYGKKVASQNAKSLTDTILKSLGKRAYEVGKISTGK